MARILRAKNPSSPKTPRQSFLGTRNATAAGTDKWSGSKHDAAELTRRTTSKSRVRVLRAVANTAVKDMTAFFTNNPNPKFDPSQAPRNPEIKRVSRAQASGGSRTHQKVFRPNRQTLFGGKVLKRKQF